MTYDTHPKLATHPRRWTRHSRWRVLVVEAKATPGDMRTLDVTLPSFHHAICSATHP